MAVKMFERLSEAYDTLKEFGFDARNIDNHAELVEKFQTLRSEYKDQPGEKGTLYDEQIRPAFVAVANGLKNVHPKLHRDENTRIHRNPVT